MELSTATPRGMLVAQMIAACCLIAGCPKPPATPEATLEVFIQDVRMGRAQAAWNNLSEVSQETIIAHAAERGRATHDTPGAAPSALLFDHLELVALRKPESISVVSRWTSENKNEVRLRVSVSEGESASIRMVREHGAWKVDLMGSLEPYAKYGADQMTATATGTSTATDTSTAPSEEVRAAESGAPGDASR